MSQIDVSYISIFHVSQDVGLLCSALEELQNMCCLISLDLSYNRLTERAMFYVASYLKVSFIINFDWASIQNCRHLAPTMFLLKFEGVYLLQ